jgi:hypothetical protein
MYGDIPSKCDIRQLADIFEGMSPSYFVLKLSCTEKGY